MSIRLVLQLSFDFPTLDFSRYQIGDGRRDAYDCLLYLSWTHDLNLEGRTTTALPSSARTPEDLAAIGNCKRLRRSLTSESLAPHLLLSSLSAGLYRGLLQLYARHQKQKISDCDDKIRRRDVS